MYEINNNIVKIDGSKGKYDNKVTNPSVRYGRNSVENYYNYIEKPVVSDNVPPAPILDFGVNPNSAEKNADKVEQFLKDNDEYINALPPLEFEYRYMPNMNVGKVDKLAVLGAAYEEMGRNKELSVKELDDRFAIDESLSSEALDVNKDGKVDIAEYAGSIVAADMFSKSDTPDAKLVDGTINKKGFDTVLAYTHKSKAEAAKKLYKDIAEEFKLDEAKQEFKPE